MTKNTQTVTGTPSYTEQLESALSAALETIKDYIAYEHNGDPWVEDARVMGEMDINDYAKDGRMEWAISLLNRSLQEDGTCEMCDDEGVVGGFSQDGSFDAQSCPDCLKSARVTGLCVDPDSNKPVSDHINKILREKLEALPHYNERSSPMYKGFENSVVGFENVIAGFEDSIVNKSSDPQSTNIVSSETNFKEKLCGCLRCQDKRMLNSDKPISIPGPSLPGWRYSCELCGNKRCPHHSDHRLACTNSNDPGQEGSIY